jgi:SAM-dependent methyltransferase
MAQMPRIFKPRTNCPICDEASEARPDLIPRDANSIKVLECAKCGHLFLDSTTHVDQSYFEKSKFVKNKENIETIDRSWHYSVEVDKRVERVREFLLGTSLLDFGCGNGDFLHAISRYIELYQGVEPTKALRSLALAKGIKVVSDLKEVKRKFSAVSLFHVLEHLEDPCVVLSQLRSNVVAGGRLVIEVPNSTDALRSLYKCVSYEKRYFFSDHLQYFCRNSLTRCAIKAGWVRVRVIGFNRFNLANHLFWLTNQLPNGHRRWMELGNERLSKAYEETLAAMDCTDTLMLLAEAP